MNVIGAALAIAGAFLVALSGGTPNGGFIVGGALAVVGVTLLTRKERNDEETGDTTNADES